MGKITVDSPIPYLLSDFGNVLQDEMGRLDAEGEDRIHDARMDEANPWGQS